MKIVRLVGLGCGVMVLIAAGAATLTRGQQPNRAAVPDRASRSTTGEDLAALEAEVELLQMRHDADREELHAFLRKCHRLEEVRDMHILNDVGLTLKFEEEFVGKDSANQSEEGMARALTLADEKQSRELEKDLKDGAARDVKKMFASLRAARESREASFLATTKAFNARKQALAEARMKFRPEGR